MGEIAAALLLLFCADRTRVRNCAEDSEVSIMDWVLTLTDFGPPDAAESAQDLDS
jgi:hypothetical protein